MKKIVYLLIAAILVVGVVAGYSLYSMQDEESIVPPGQTITNENYQTYVDESDIIRETSDLGGVYKKYYSKYIDYIAPNEKPIRIVAQDKVTDEQILYAYSLLAFYLEHNLTDKKVEIANKIANEEAVIVMPNGADGESSIPDQALEGQPLYQLETPNVGSKWYIENDYEYRDAAFEEIFHLVHDYGIGTTQNPKADSKTSKLIADATQNALPSNKDDWGTKGLWGLNELGWLTDLEREGSLEQEYIASVIDSYYGLWEAFEEKEGGMWGIYIAKDRNEIMEKDPVGFEMIEKILPKYIATMMRIDPSFEGTFKIVLDESNKYTFKSQYLQNIRLTGAKDSNILGNSLDNIFMGNSGDNTIDGAAGKNIVQFKGKSTEYEIISKDGYIEVTDTINQRDGKDTLKNISILRFTDKDIIN